MKSGTLSTRQPPAGLFERARSALHGPNAVLATLGGLLVISCLVNLNLGVISLTPHEVLSTLVGQGTEQQELALLEFRMPRIVLAVLVGIGMALSGAILQGVSRNPLVDPGLLGINAGAGLGVAALLLLEPTLGSWTFAFPLAALLGAGLAALATYSLGFKRGDATPSRLVLVGIAVGFGIAAIELLISLRLDEQVYERLVIWLAGSLSGITWNYPLALLPWMLLLVPITLVKSEVLNVLNLGDQVAIGLGASVRSQRLLLLAVAVGLAGSSVALSGAISFIGLLGPHIARRLVGPNHVVLLPTAALVGAVLLVIADTLARNLVSQAELPVGIVVAVLGAPYFLFLLVKTRG